MEREEHRQVVVPMGFQTTCRLCFQVLSPGTTVYAIDGYGYICESCEGKQEPRAHRLSRIGTDWMAYEGRT